MILCNKLSSDYYLKRVDDKGLALPVTSEHEFVSFYKNIDNGLCKVNEYEKIVEFICDEPHVLFAYLTQYSYHRCFKKNCIYSTVFIECNSKNSNIQIQYLQKSFKENRIIIVKKNNKKSFRINVSSLTTFGIKCVESVIDSQIINKEILKFFIDNKKRYCFYSKKDFGLYSINSKCLTNHCENSPVNKDLLLFNSINVIDITTMIFRDDINELIDFIVEQFETYILVSKHPNTIFLPHIEMFWNSGNTEDDSLC